MLRRDPNEEELLAHISSLKLEAQGFEPRSPEPDDCYRPSGGLYSSMLDLIRYVGVHLNAWPCAMIRRQTFP